MKSNKQQTVFTIGSRTSHQCVSIQSPGVIKQNDDFLCGSPNKKEIQFHSQHQKM